MAQLRFYCDEDAGYSDRVDALRRAGFDVQTAVEARMLGRPDPEHLAYATNAGRVLISHNTGDYYALHTAYLQSGRRHAGIVLIRQQRYSVGEIVRRLRRLDAASAEAGMANQIDFLGV